MVVVVIVVVIMVVIVVVVMVVIMVVVVSVIMIVRVVVAVVVAMRRGVLRIGLDQLLGRHLLLGRRWPGPRMWSITLSSKIGARSSISAAGFFS